MNITPWRRREAAMPYFSEIEDFMNRLWGGNGDYSNQLPEVFRNRLFPAVNIAEAEDSFTITMDCPGLTEKDFQIEAIGSNLIISGERKWEEEKKGKEFRRVESQYGKFERTVQLPDRANLAPEGVQASYSQGVLTVTVPKAKKTAAARIQVRGG
jgi:HSP20 family protein